MSTPSTLRKEIAFRLNGSPARANVATHENLVEMLQGEFGLNGARESCGQGLCGCCTVMVDGKPVTGCLYPAAFVDGAEVVTIEHVPSTGRALDPVQEAFVEAGALQCGYCTPGMVLMTRALLEKHPDPSEDEIKHWLAGNLCRCAAYPEIVRAVQAAAARRKGATA
jgi:carbon-monoxide dehydrogenase small subunit